MPRKAKPNPINRSRQSREFVRCYESMERKKWIAAMPCLVRGCDGKSVNAHAPGDGGAGYKASARYIVPLCDPHHRESHRGIETFQVKYGLDLNAESAKVQTLWEAYCLDGWRDGPEMHIGNV